METVTLTINSANKLRITQKPIERKMLGISLGEGHVENVEMRRRTRVEDVTVRIARMNWS